MRISELAQATGVPVATVKYYLREGILHAGTPVSARLSTYDESHVRRLRLLRVLREVGDVPVHRLQPLTQAVEAHTTIHDLLAIAADVVAPSPPAPDEQRELGRELADQVIAHAGWQVREGSPDRENLAAVIGRWQGYTGAPLTPDILSPYVEEADRIAQWEIASLDESHGRGAVLEQMVVGQVVFGEILSVLRRLAEEHHSSVRFG